MAAQFSSKRVGKLIRKHWVENTQYHLFATLALIGAIGIVLLIWGLYGGNQYEESDLLNIFFFGLYICGSVYASSTFKMLQKKETGTYWLSIPASHLEKLITAIFYNLIVFTVVYILCYFLVMQVATSIITARVAADPSRYSFEKIDWENKNISGTFSLYKCYSYLFFGSQALYMLGSVYFKRYSIILTTFTLAVAFLLLGCYLNLLDNSLPEHYLFDGAIVHYYNGFNDTPSVHYSLPMWVDKTMRILVCFGWAPVFWWATYFRLKEKEI